MSTKHKSFIPMLSEERPKQRLYEVVELPVQPKHLDPKVKLFAKVIEIGASHFEKQRMCSTYFNAFWISL